MALHYSFDEPLDVSSLLRGIAHDIENRPTNFRYGPQDPTEGQLQVTIGALREAADKIERAIYDASTKT